MTYLENRITARWWDYTRVVEKEKIDTIIENLYRVPSKQCGYEQKCVIFGPNSYDIKKNIYDNYAWADENNKLLGPGVVKYFNGQLLAQYLFMWVTRYKEVDGTEENWAIQKYRFEKRIQKAFLESGIGAGVVMTIAEDLGLDTGFSICFDSKNVANALGYTDEYALVALGVGYMQDHSDVSNPCLLKAVYHENKIVGYDNYNIPQHLTDKIRKLKPSNETIVEIR
jgi:hypothetical protein